VPSRTGQPDDDSNTALAWRRRTAARRSARHGAPLWFFLVVSAAVPASYYGALTARGNFHEVVPQRVYRSGQPTPSRLRAWINRYGLKTIVNLRGENAPDAQEEKALAASLGVDEVCLGLSAYALMTRRELLTLMEVLQTARQPLLLHCFHGVDRAGTASALAAWLLGGQPYERAKWQAYVPSGPWKRWDSPDHISDTLTLYEDYCRAHGVNPDDTSLFKHWAANIYDPRPSMAGRDRP
jgi:protein tyrosine phosphatase (PTP) superfamily phosphohydrolase (DUF442 family)